MKGENFVCSSNKKSESYEPLRLIRLWYCEEKFDNDHWPLEFQRLHIARDGRCEENVLYQLYMMEVKCHLLLYAVYFNCVEYMV